MQGQSASAPNLRPARSPLEEVTPSWDPTTSEETMRSLKRASTQQDLGSFSPMSVSSSLVSYEDDSPDSLEGEHQPPVGEKEPEDMGEYPTTGQYTPASEDEEEENISSNKNLEAPYLAP